MKKHSLKIRTRPSRMVSIRIPERTLDSLKEVAGHKDMGYQALIKFYVGQGLRADLATRHSQRVIDATTRILHRHLKSPRKVVSIVKEIRKVAR
ncbi:MAG: hypothetical protein Q8S00_13000 [Deltaproteobacteria bacterium]|nr:hypothetical protein [Deltaproteobacteria bacterium]MDZ4342383.1 hypothetical protein [Candidatus Binatia bacterium]